MKLKLKLRKNQIILLCAAVALALAALVFGLLCASQGRVLEAQQAAARFRGGSESRFAQVSAFFPLGKEAELTGIRTFRNSLPEKLTAAGLEQPENGSLWRDAFCGFSSVSVQGIKATAQTQVIGVGGDFFAFHPLRLRSGAYLYEDDLMHDTVILDETLAWKLFGGYDLAGMTVVIDGKPYHIAGVVERETDSADRKAYTDDGLMFMHFDAMSALTEEGVGVSCYELCCADPITGFALELVSSGFSDATALQNTRRFSLGSLLKVIGGFDKRAMSSDGVAYPYWENAARLTETRAGVLLLLCLLFSQFPLVLLIYLAVKLIKKSGGALSVRVKDRWEKAADALREKKRLKLVKKETEHYGE